MCMPIPYNSVRGDGFFVRSGQKGSIGVAFLAMALLGTSCGKAPLAPSETGTARPAADAIREAEDLYKGRTDLVKVREAIVSLRQAQADHPTDYDLAWRLAKFDYYLGSHSTESHEQDKAFHEGIDAGKLAVQLQDGKPDGHFWLGANYGGSAKLSVLAGLSEVDDIKREMETVLKLDEGYQSGSAYMVLGQVYLEAPKLLGGDVEKSIGYLEKGIKFGPDNALLKVTLARAYAEAHRNADAQKQIDELMKMKPAAGYEPEYNEAVAEAKTLQDKLK